MIESMGLSLSGGMNIDTSHSLIQWRLPFEVPVLDGHVMNGETRRALLESDAKDAGLIEDDAHAFATAQEAIAFLRQL